MKEAFLICALAAAPGSFSPGFTSGSIQIQETEARQALEVAEEMRDRWLIVDGPESVMNSLKNKGRVYGVTTLDDTGLNPWHVRSRPEAIPFPYDLFDMVFWMRDNRHIHSDRLTLLTEAAFHVIPGGIFIFDAQENIGWIPMLYELGWEKLDTRINGMDMWRRPKGLKRWFSHPNLMRWLEAAA